MEVELPNDQVAKFEKFFNGKALGIEIDKIHGIEPALCPWKDVPLKLYRPNFLDSKNRLE